MTPRLLRAAALVLALVLIGDRVGTAVLRRVILSSESRFSVLYRGAATADVVVVGDSRAVNAVNSPGANRDGRRVFNLGYNGMGTTLAEALVRDYFEHNKHPKVVLLEVTGLTQQPELVNELKTYAGFSPRLASLYATQHPTASRARRVFTLFDFNSELFLRALYYLRRSDQDWNNSSRISSEVAAAAVNEEAWRLKALPENLEALARLADFVHGQGADLKLFVAPYLPAHLAHLQNLAEFKATVQTRTPGATLFDYSSSVAQVGFFADRIHLNRDGTSALMAQMIQDHLLDLPAR